MELTNSTLADGLELLIKRVKGEDPLFIPGTNCEESLLSFILVYEKELLQAIRNPQ